MKRCSSCKETKEIEAFSKNKNQKDGHNTYCRICANEKRKSYMTTKHQLTLEKDEPVMKISEDDTVLQGNIQVKEMESFESGNIKRYEVNHDFTVLRYANGKYLLEHRTKAKIGKMSKFAIINFIEKGIQHGEAWI